MHVLLPFFLSIIILCLMTSVECNIEQLTGARLHIDIRISSHYTILCQYGLCNYSFTIRKPCQSWWQRGQNCTFCAVSLCGYWVVGVLILHLYLLIANLWLENRPIWFSGANDLRNIIFLCGPWHLISTEFVYFGLPFSHYYYFLELNFITQYYTPNTFYNWLR